MRLLEPILTARVRFYLDARELGNLVAITYFSIDLTMQGMGRIMGGASHKLSAGHKAQR
jgi:hypothetical protein